MHEVLTVVLAGGAGERLMPLTHHHAKPFMPFGGIYRLIDISLSNCINSGLRKIYVLTQHKALSLNRHLRETWNILSPELGQFIEVLPPTKRVSDNWYLGTADSVYQNIQSLHEEDCSYTLILSSDHIYKMNYLQMLDWHLTHGADVTVAATRVAPQEAERFGIIRLNRECVVEEFVEKPEVQSSDCSPFNWDVCRASMGLYLFTSEILLEALREDGEDAHSSHDFGRDLLPKLIGHRRVMGYDFVDENKKDVLYWRDVGTLDSYYDANMDLVSVSPVFNLYDRSWPIIAHQWQSPPAKFVFADEGQRMGIALNSIVSQGCILSGARIKNCVLSPNVRVESYSEIDHSILFPNVTIGSHCRIRRAIVDQNLVIPDGYQAGWDLGYDRLQDHHVTSSGVVVVHAGSKGIKPISNKDDARAFRARAAG
jgi:glucose-1-phosphate adenylyltransferase